MRHGLLQSAKGQKHQKKKSTISTPSIATRSITLPKNRGLRVLQLSMGLLKQSFAFIHSEDD